MNFVINKNLIVLTGPTAVGKTDYKKLFGRF